MCETTKNIKGGNMEAALLSLLKENKDSQARVNTGIQELNLAVNTLQLKNKTMEEFITRVTTSDAYTLPICAQSRQDMFIQINKLDDKLTNLVKEEITAVNKKFDLILSKIEENKNSSKIDVNDIIKKVFFGVLTLGVGYLFSQLTS